jgi:hypothetical protein
MSARMNPEGLLAAAHAACSTKLMQYASFNASGLYIDVRSAWHKPGEIRAQLNPLMELYDGGI